jgi:hypothetical protein
LQSDINTDTVHRNQRTLRRQWTERTLLDDSARTLSVMKACGYEHTLHRRLGSSRLAHRIVGYKMLQLALPSLPLLSFV